MCEAFAYVWSGMYGDVEKIGAGNSILIILQLTFAGVIIMMLDEMLEKVTQQKYLNKIKLNLLGLWYRIRYFPFHCH